MAIKTQSGSLTFGSGDTSKSTSFPGAGVWIRLNVVIPTFTNSVTATVSMVGPSSVTMWIVNGLAMGASYTFVPNVPSAGESVNVSVTLSGAPGGSGGTVSLRGYIQCD